MCSIDVFSEIQYACLYSGGNDCAVLPPSAGESRLGHGTEKIMTGQIGEYETVQESCRKVCCENDKSVWNGKKIRDCKSVWNCKRYGMRKTQTGPPHAFCAELFCLRFLTARCISSAGDVRNRKSERSAISGKRYAGSILLLMRTVRSVPRREFYLDVPSAG